MRERAEDLTGIGIAVVIWASAALAGAQSIHKLAKLPQNTPGWLATAGWRFCGPLLRQRRC